MRSPALLSGDSGDEHGVRDVKEKAELERLGQVVVEDRTLIVDENALVTLAERVDDFTLPLHLLRAAEDAEVFVHRQAKLVADPPRALAVRPIEQFRQLAPGIPLDRPRNLNRRV